MTRAEPPRAPQRDYLRETGDAVSRVVTAPMRIVVPGKKVEAPKEAEAFEAPSALFIRRTRDDRE